MSFIPHHELLNYQGINHYHSHRHQNKQFERNQWLLAIVSGILQGGLESGVVHLFLEVATIDDVCDA